MRIRALGGLLACAAMVATGCGESHVGDEDAAIVFPDGTFIDGGPPDSGPVIGDQVGDACTEDGECGDDGVCIGDPEFLPGGYCSIACAADEDCGPTGACLDLGGGQAFCFQTCEPGTTPRQCRAGYGCGSVGLGSPPVCVGGCTDDTDCADGSRCDPTAGFTGGGGCYLPDAAIGDACASTDACPMGGLCIDEAANGWPNGTCATLGACDPSTNTGCPGDAQCIPNGGQGLCVDGCVTAADCRVGYECRGLSGARDRLVCAPGCTADEHCSGDNVCNIALGSCAVPFDPSLLGDACSQFTGGCEGGSCLDERTYGNPFGECTYVGCTVGSDETCPTGGVCAPGTGENAVCRTGCTIEADCRPGYACRNVVPGDDTSSRACFPDCQAESECQGMSRDCNFGTGLCTRPFSAAAQGTMCTGVDDCIGGDCLTEEDGWPGGMCVAVGCSLASGTVGVACPVGATCVDDEAGRAEIGHCLNACTLGATDACRTGYTCTAIVDGGTEAVCRPTPVVPPKP